MTIFPTDSATLKCLETPELLIAIFEAIQASRGLCCAGCGVRNPDLATAASVSRSWWTVALDMLWRSVSLVHVLEVLAPLIPGEAGLVSKFQTDRTITGD